MLTNLLKKLTVQTKRSDFLQPGDRVLFEGRVVSLEGTWMSPHTYVMRLTCRDVRTGEAVEIKTSKGTEFALAQ